MTSDGGGGVISRKKIQVGVMVDVYIMRRDRNGMGRRKGTKGKEGDRGRMRNGNGGNRRNGRRRRRRQWRRSKDEEKEMGQQEEGKGM